MNICHHASALFLLLFAAALASFMGEAFNFEDMKQQLEEIEQKRAQEGDCGGGPVGVNDSMQAKSFGGLSFNIDPNSTLEQVNRELEGIRKEFCQANHDPELAEINNHALAALSITGYLPEHDLLSEVDGAIKEKCYEFLKSLFPTTRMIWWRGDSDLAMLLAKALGRTEWMSKEEWEKHINAVDWNLHFRSLIRSGNENVYKDEEFSNLIFRNEIFKECFQDIIREAYDSGITAFLSAIPYPSKEFPLNELDGVFFWSLAFGQDWCSKEWGDYINTVEDIDYAFRALQIFTVENPKIFGHERVKTFLESYKIGETLKVAIVFDSLSFAQYLRGKHGEEEFKKMIEVENCPKVHTLGKKFSPFERSYRNEYEKERLSRVYNFLLENGRDLKHDIDSIQFSNVPILNEKYLQPLLDCGFNKMPSSQSDFELYGRSATGINFLTLILNGGYGVNGKTWKLWTMWMKWERCTRGRWGTWGELGTWEEVWSFALSRAEVDKLDIEAFKLISGYLGEVVASETFTTDDARVFVSYNRKRFYQGCMIAAIRKRDIKFLTDVRISTFTAINGEDLTFDSTLLLDSPYSPISVVFIEAAKGNLAILDWIFYFNPELLEKVTWEIINLSSYSFPPHVPLLKYLFKKSREKELPPYTYLAKYAESHLLRAISYKNPDHYKEVCGIEGVMEAMNVHGFKIPKFPGGE